MATQGDGAKDGADDTATPPCSPAPDDATAAGDAALYAANVDVYKLFADAFFDTLRLAITVNIALAGATGFILENARNLIDPVAGVAALANLLFTGILWNHKALLTVASNELAGMRRVQPNVFAAMKPIPGWTTTGFVAIHGAISVAALFLIASRLAV